MFPQSSDIFTGRQIAVLLELQNKSLLSEEHRLEVFENRVLRRIFGPKRDEVTEEWRKTA
jgi:hypothetical protein